MQSKGPSARWGKADTEEEAQKLAGPGGLYFKAEDLQWACKWAFFICAAIAILVTGVLVYLEPAFRSQP